MFFASVNLCSTTPVVFSRAFKTSSVRPNPSSVSQSRSMYARAETSTAATDRKHSPSVGKYILAVIRSISSR